MSIEADESLLSSPDPLANSPDIAAFSSPSKPSRTSLPGGSTLKQTNSTLKNETVQLQDFVISTPSNKLNTLDLSPTRSKAKTENALSPWRIRVTVEAERDEDGNRNGKDAAKLLNFQSPAKKSKAQTTVTTVPVKGLGSSPPASKRRARPRKSCTTPVKRNGTPRPSRRSRRLSMDHALGETVQDQDKTATKNDVETPVTRKDQSGVLPISPAETNPSANTNHEAPGRRGRGRRSIASPVKIAVHSFLDSHETVPSEEPEIARETGQVLRDIDTNSAASSSGASNQHASEEDGIGVISSKESSKSVSKHTGNRVTALKKALFPTTGAKVKYSRSHGGRPQNKDNRTNDEDLWRNSTIHDGSKPADSPIESAEGFHHQRSVDQVDGNADNEQREDENANPGELDSVLESEAFSMVSIASIPSAREHLSSPDSKSPDQREPSLVGGCKSNSYQYLSPANRLGSSKSTSMTGLRTHSRSDHQNVLAFEEAISQYPKSSMIMALTKSPQLPVKYQGRVQNKATEDHSVSSNRYSRTSVTDADFQSSPPARVAKHDSQLAQQTPSIVYSSPTLPPPLNPATTKKSQTPKLARVIRTGLALQNILSNEARLRSPFSSPAKASVAKQKSPKERLDDLFSGFGDGTRRELRAGLKLGEELAKRQAENNRPIDERASAEPSGDNVFAEETTGYPRLPTPEDSKEYSLPLPDKAHQEVSYPTLLSPGQSSSPAKLLTEKNYDAMSWRVDTPAKIHPTEVTPSAQPQQDVGNKTNWSTMEGREAKWQREREAVSRQIQNANESQVIVIEDTAVVGDDGEVTENSSQDELAEPQRTPQQDIWQAEAHSTSPAASPGLPVTQDPYPTVDMLKPPRGKIPSPWRRNGKIVYSDEAVEDEAALFWQPDTCSKQASRAREERRRRKDEAKLEALPFPSLKPKPPTADRVHDKDSQIFDDGDEMKQEELATEALDNKVYTADRDEVLDEESCKLNDLSEECSTHIRAVEDVSEIYTDEEAEKNSSGEESALQTDDADEDDSEVRQGEATSGFIDTSSRQVVRQLNDELQAAAKEDSLQPSTHVDDAPSQASSKAPPQVSNAGFRSRFFSGLSAFTPSFLQSQSKTTVSTTSQKVTTSVSRQLTSHTLTSERLSRIISQNSAELSICEPWTITNYKVIQELYNLARAAPSAPSKYTTHRYYGKTVAGNGHSIVLECKELWVVEVFNNILREKSTAGKAGGRIEFDDWYLASRVFSLVYGEECRREEAEAKRQKELRARGLESRQASL
ncbi:MAG: hypothetical protein M1835_003252 [Candelina submexicana]|nr:MAG: hypothetical protein M1835_003252 [Candelina submexicana]